jgi:hypothetical protein
MSNLNTQFILIGRFTSSGKLTKHQKTTQRPYNNLNIIIIWKIGLLLEILFYSIFKNLFLNIKLKQIKPKLYKNEIKQGG